MTPPFHPDELGIQTPPGERAALKDLANRLEAERPLPAAGFRGELRRRLTRDGVAASRPARLQAKIAGYGVSGAALLLFGASSAAGLGPLGA